jgi:hypothetical protein
MMSDFFGILSLGILLGFLIGWFLSTNSTNKYWVTALKVSDVYTNGNLQKDLFKNFNPKFKFYELPKKFKFEIDASIKKETV